MANVVPVELIPVKVSVGIFNLTPSLKTLELSNVWALNSNSGGGEGSGGWIPPPLYDGIVA